MARMHLKKRRGLRRAGIATLAVSGALVAGGCADIGTYGDHHTLSFWKESSAYIAQHISNPACRSGDFAGNGGVGDAKDISACAFFSTRVNVCNRMDGLKHGICNAATELNATTSGGTPMWFSWYAAATNLTGNNSCLQVDFGSGGDIRRWKAAPLGFEGCRTMPALPGTG